MIEPAAEPGTPVPLKEGPTMSERPNIVLVHGAYADGSCWSAVIQSLQAEGYDAGVVGVGEADVYPLDGGAGAVHAVAATSLRSMDVPGIGYSIVFPTPMLNLGFSEEEKRAVLGGSALALFGLPAHGITPHR
jgi:hypothetical protein